MDAFATAISLCLQYGVPLDALVKKFTHQRFEPSGMTANRDIPFAKSIIDYIFRWLGLRFLAEYRKQHLPDRDQPSDENSSAPEAVKEDASSVPGRADLASDKEARGPLGASSGGSYVSSRTAKRRKDGGNGDGRKAQALAATETQAATRPVANRVNRIDEQFRHCQEDAPACDVCGAITVRNGNCYKCYNCGSSLGCS